MVAVNKVKMCFCSEKKKSQQENKNQNFLWAHKTFSPQHVQLLRKFHMATTTTARKCTKKSAARAKLFFAEYFVYKISEEIFYPNLLEICMKTPCWCPPGWAPTWWTETNKNICYWVLVQKSEFIPRGTHIHIRWLRIINEEGLLELSDPYF